MSGIVQGVDQTVEEMGGRSAKGRGSGRGRKEHDPDEERREAKEYALLLLSYRMRSEAETRERLSRRGYAPDLIAATVLDLSRVGLLDDREFSRGWIRNRLATNPAGRRVIRLELGRKGIDAAIIDEALREIENEYDERALAMRVARKKIGQYGGLDRGIVRRRLVALLARRGFEYGVIEEVVRELLEPEQGG